jgi:hypothetical protein
MTEERNQLAELFAACWKDEALKQRFMNDPKAVLAEYDMPVPDGMDVKVVENADNCVHITMPVAPDGHHDLSDEELSAAAGGTDSQAVPPDSSVPVNRCGYACTPNC